MIILVSFSQRFSVGKISKKYFFEQVKTCNGMLMRLLNNVGPKGSHKDHLHYLPQLIYLVSFGGLHTCIMRDDLGLSNTLHSSVCLPM